MPSDALASIPGPAPAPLLGSRVNLVRFLLDPIAYMRMLHRDYGTIASFVRGRPGIVFAFGPEYNKQILSDPARYYSTGITMPGPSDSPQRHLGYGLLSMNGPQHQFHRRLVMPMFYRKQVESYRETIATIIDETLAGWRPGRLDVWRALQQLTRRITSRVLFGLEDPREGEALGCMMERWLQMNTSFLVRLAPADRPGSPYRRMLAYARRLEQQVRNLVALKRPHAARSSDVLSLLIQATHEDGSALTDDELIGQINILFGAAHVTTTDALSWTCFLLSQHPAVYADLVDELDGVLRGGLPTTEQFAQLPLLERVIKESLRLLPPPVYNCRLTTAPVTLGPYQLPAGATVAFSHYITHHMPELFPRPEAFWPDRWLTAAPSPYAYIPFGAGPRMCIGEPFAQSSMRLILSAVLQRFRLSCLPGTRIDRRVTITLSPKHGLPMEVVPQDRQFRRVPVRGNIHEMVELE